LSRSSDRFIQPTQLALVGMLRIGVSPSALVCAVYLLALASAELLLLTSGLVAGAVAHTILIAVLLVHAIAAPDAPYRPLLVVLVLPSLIRMLGLTIPVAGTPQLVWYAMAGVPSLLAALLAARVIRLPARLFVMPAHPWVQLSIVLSGVSTGLLAYVILRPAPLSDSPILAPAAAVVLALFVAATEELVFRGNLQEVVRDLFGSEAAAIAVSAGAFALMYAGALSLPFTIVMLSMGLLLGWTVQQTGSLWGAIGAHMVMLIGLMVVWPLLLQ
jgi:membrane protease YdiL (CAAX protease family)